MQIAILAEKLSESFAMPIGTKQVSSVRLWSLKQQDVFYILFLGALQNGASALPSKESDLWVCLEN